MDLDALKNLNVKDFLEKIKSGGGADLLKDKKTLIKFGSVAVAILFFLIVYYAFVSPIIGAQEERLDVMNENQNTVDEYLNNINTLETRVKELEPQYKKSSKLFHSKKEVEDLYQNISNYAMKNGLSIINIKKGEPTPASGNENSGENYRFIIDSKDKEIEDLKRTIKQLKLSNDKRGSKALLRLAKDDLFR